MSNDLLSELIRRFSVDYHALQDNLRIFVAQFHLFRPLIYLLIT
ncbi:hypothetical protein PJ15_2522 [Acinetobacter sp. neg1]|nr:hypothetical protein PJ15_2522 [Acinetobacter sp. neg1]